MDLNVFLKSGVVAASDHKEWFCGILVASLEQLIVYIVGKGF